MMKSEEETTKGNFLLFGNDHFSGNIPSVGQKIKKYGLLPLDDDVPSSGWAEILFLPLWVLSGFECSPEPVFSFSTSEL